MNVLHRHFEATPGCWRRLLPATLLLIMFVSGCYFACVSTGDGVEDDFDTVLSRWRQGLQDVQGDPDSRCPAHVVGECDGGRKLFLYDYFIDAGTTRFYDADTGEFLWLKTVGGSCRPRTPLHRCENAVVTEVLCGTAYEVGDAFP